MLAFVPASSSLDSLEFANGPTSGKVSLGGFGFCLGGFADVLPVFVAHENFGCFECVFEMLRVNTSGLGCKKRSPGL